MESSYRGLDSSQNMHVILAGLISLFGLLLLRNIALRNRVAMASLVVAIGFANRYVNKIEKIDSSCVYPVLKSSYLPLNVSYGLVYDESVGNLAVVPSACFSPDTDDCLLTSGYVDIYYKKHANINNYLVDNVESAANTKSELFKNNLITVYKKVARNLSI